MRCGCRLCCEYRTANVVVVAAVVRSAYTLYCCCGVYSYDSFIDIVGIVCTGVAFEGFFDLSVSQSVSQSVI